MRLISNFIYLLRQRFAVSLIAIFLSLVLFNTTYLGLGTNIPLVVIVMGLVFFPSEQKSNSNKKNVYFIWLAIVIFLSTLLSDGENFHECLKIFITVLFVYMATSIKIDDNEVRYLSLFICVSYLVYAILVIGAIGQDTEYYGRAQIRILNSEIPLDPNVVAAVFIFPMILSLYNLLYGKYKLLAGFFLIVFIIAVVALGSRGATISFIAAGVLLLLKYFSSRAIPLWIKIVSVAAIFTITIVVSDFISGQNAIFGFDRILDFSGDDASNGRTGVWEERLDLFTHSPLWGYGANYNMGSLHKGMACHNTFIQIIYYGGLIGISLFLVPIFSLYRRTSMSIITKISLFLSVFIPVFFIDTLQERTIWNFLIFYSLLSVRHNAEECLLWNLKRT